MALPPASGPSRPKRTAAAAPASAARPPAKAGRPAPTARPTSASAAAAAAAARKGKAPARPSAADVAAAKAASNLQEGEEEWAALMKKNHDEPKGADWYAKGVKSVQVSSAALHAN